MSKNNMLLGYARGKVGSLVFNRLKGQQITKAHNASPANPKSYAQMAQRCRYNTAVARYKMATRKFFKFAYEDKRPHESDFNAFMRHNMMVEPLVTKWMAQHGNGACAPLKVSSGSLASPVFECDFVSNIGVILTNNRTVNCIAIGYDESSWSFLDALDETSTVEDLNNLLLSNIPSLKVGDLLTFCSYYLETGSWGVEGWREKNMAGFSFTQHKISDSHDTTLIQSLGGDSSFLMDEEQYMYINFGQSDTEDWDETAVFAGIIVTRKEGSKILANNCILKPNTVVMYNSPFITEHQGDAQAIASYSPTSPAILNPDK